MLDIITPLQHDDERARIAMEAFDQGMIDADRSFEEVIQEFSTTVHNLAPGQVIAFAADAAFDAAKHARKSVPSQINEAENAFLASFYGGKDV